MADFAFVPVEAILAKSEIKIEEGNTETEQHSNESFIDFENDEHIENVHQNERFDYDFCDQTVGSNAENDSHGQGNHVETAIKTEVCDDMQIQQDVKNLR